ncbi:MAG: HD domain-containing protein [Treponema sp.]|nr:HD domain-containing protein [Treponema sp.]
MILRMDSLIQVIARALDMVEITFLGVTTNHGKRIAVLCAAMGRYLGMSDPEVSDLVSCALLHDNALTEYILLKEGREEDDPDISEHCIIGQNNAEILPFNGNIDGYILYHHEQADGRGPFKLSEGQYPLGAEIIAAADMVDAEWQVERTSIEGLPDLRNKIKSQIHRCFSKRAGNAMLEILDTDMLVSLKNENVTETVCRSLPVWNIDIHDPALIPFAALVSRIIDYKSKSTGIHTQQIANRSWLMSEYYSYDLTEKIQMYLAAALHDIGKLAIPTEVLDKPGKLNDEEYKIIQGHIVQTRSLLSEMEGLGPITEWASNHHEKLDGSGYPLRKNAADLDFNSRLMACIDIYQAVSEKRPYHTQRTHDETMAILNEMADNGKIDPKIVKDIDKVMAEWSQRDVDTPSL